ncbi:rhodanese-like domain-containing protein [Saprospiraceae bacterium]|jgi:adenylyltransferase/sulfurtransferase|nr:rhodanese-like domain-containing protein [Bacteroidota bacterium]MDB4728292.1 rhodanese-like domain-containing protein [Saprospiraceae bacterium]MDF1867919.1 rhodanese-like domain-containing protein [Saprospiraceae bacterium]
MNFLDYDGLIQWREAKKDYQLIDVREVTEHESFNIGGLNIPLSEVLKGTDKLEFSKPIVVYCKRGVRSRIAIQRLEMRFPDAEFYNLNKGIMLIDKDSK